MEKLKIENPENKIEQIAFKNMGKKDVGSLLEYLGIVAENIMQYADWYEFGEDVVIEFEECCGNDLISLLNAVQEYGVDLENVKIYSNDDGWVTVGVFIG